MLHSILAFSRRKIFEFCIGGVRSRWAVEQVFQIVVWVKPVGFCHLYHGINYHTRICTILAVTKQPVLTAQCHRAEGILRWGVTQSAASVYEVSQQSVFSISDICYCPIHAVPCFWMLVIEPAHEAFPNRLCILLAAFVYLCIGQSFFLIASFVFKQFAAVKDTLYCRMAVVFLMALRDDFHQVSLYVCLTAAAAYLLQLVITTVTIHHNIGTFIDPIQKVHCISPGSGFCIMI